MHACVRAFLPACLLECLFMQAGRHVRIHACMCVCWCKHVDGSYGGNNLNRYSGQLFVQVMKIGFLHYKKRIFVPARVFHHGIQSKNDPRIHRRRCVSHLVDRCIGTTKHCR